MEKFELDFTTKVAPRAVFLGVRPAKYWYGGQLHRDRLAFVNELVPYVKEARKNPCTIFLKHVETYHHENGDPLSDEEVAMLFNAVYFGGLTNTVNGVANALYFAASYPEKLKQLEAEPDDSPLATAWVLETSRLSSGFLGSNRIVVQDGYDIGGYKLPPDVLVMADIKTSSILSKEFDEPAFESFCPERFLAPQSQDASRYGILNWGMGTHVCPAKAFAMTEMQIILNAVMRNLTLSRPSQGFSIRYKATHSMAPVADNYVVHFKKIKK